MINVTDAGNLVIKKNHVVILLESLFFKNTMIRPGRGVGGRGNFHIKV